MLYRSFLLSLVLVGCGDNLLLESGDSGVPDARVDSPADADPDSLTPPNNCTDSVTAVKTGNPGGDPASYPADGWWSDDTRTNGMVTVDDTIEPPAAFGCTSARFVTGATTTPGPSQDKAQLISYAKAGVALSTISNIKYWAYRSSASTGGPAVQLAINVFITGTSVPGNYASLTYEPYQQMAGQDAIHNDEWQQWNATSTAVGEGKWWTSKIANPNPGSQAMPIPWADFQTMFSDAKVLGYGFNLGSFNPNMIVAGDGLEFGTTTTDF